MNGELQKEFIPTTINPALRRFKTSPTDDNRLSLATIKAEQVSWNNSNLDEPTSNLHFFGCFRTRRQRNLKTGYRLGHAHETTISSETDEEMNDLEILDSDDERIESHSESGDADCVEVQTGPVSLSTLSSEGNMSVSMKDNDSLSQSCRTSDPQYCEKYESKIQTELPPSSLLNSSEGSMITNSLNSDYQKMCADVPTMDQPSNDDTLDSTLVQMFADVPTMDQPSNDDTLESTLVQMCAGVPTMDQPSNDDILDNSLVQMCAGVPTMDQPSNDDTLDSTLVQMCADVPTMDQPSNDDILNSTLVQMCADVPNIDHQSVDDTLDSTLVQMCADVPNIDHQSVDDTLDSTLVQMCADVPNIDHQSVDDTLDSNPKQGEQDYFRKLRRKRTVIEDDNRLTFYDCHIKKDKVFLQSNQNKQMNSESQEARASSTSEPQCKITIQENARTAMESKTNQDLADDQLYETRPELDQEHMAFLAKLRKIKTKCTDDNRLTFFENYTVVQVIPREDNSVPVPGRNSSVSKGQRNFVPDSGRLTVKDKANEDKHFITVQNQPASTDSRSKRSTRSGNNNKKTTVGKNSDEANHHGPFRNFKSDLQSEPAMKDKKSRQSDGDKDTKISERKTPQTSLKSRPSPNVPPGIKTSQGTASHGKTSDLDNYEWYFKGINRAESEKILRDKGNNGCFMVRDSSRPGMYSISLFYKASRRRGHVKHYLISKSMDDKFYLEKKQEFTTIPELVDYYKLHVGCLITLLGNPPVRKNDDIVRTSTGFVSDSDDTSLSSEESLPSEDESQGDLILVGQGDNNLDTEDGQLYLEESVWDNVMETETERCLKLNPLPIGRGRNTVLCIDISASMSGTAWDQMKTALVDFLQGLEENAKEDGPEENVAIITFGHQTRVALTLTNDYIQVKHTLDQLYPDGVSPLAAGMALIKVPLVCIQATRPMYVDLHGIHVYPRAVFFTDCKATPAGMISGNDECPEKDRDEVQANLVLQCEKIWAEIKVEFVFVPIGDANRTILGTLAEGRNGKIEEYTNIKRLISLSRNMGLACQIGGHMLPGMKSSDNLDSFFFKSLVAAISPELTSQEVDDMLEIVEKFHTQKKNQEPGSLESSVSEEQNTFEELRRDKLPPLGTRVQRGHRWKWGNHDSLGPGTITGHSKQDDNNVYVQWDNGFKFSYEVGSEVEVIDQPKPSTLVKLSVCVGCMVRRGPHWQWGNVDGEPGALGTVYRVEHDKTVHVRWQKTGNKGNYRCGRDGMFDVIVCNPEDPYESKITEEVLNKRNREKEQKASKHLKVSSIGKRFPKRTEVLTKDTKSISWYKEPIIQLSQPTERNSDLEGTQESFLKINETSSGDQIMSVIGEQSYIKSEKLHSCEQNNETTASWEVKELQDISLEKEKTLSGGVVNESKLAEKSLSPDTHDDLGESNSMEKFENAAFFNDLEVNIDALETVQESLMERNEALSGDLILSITGEQSSIKDEKLNPCKHNSENTSWEVKELQDISLEKEKTLSGGLVNESKLAEKSLSPDTQDDLGESNSMEKFENAAFFNDLKVNIDALETVQESLMERNEASSGDLILSITGEQSSIKDEKLNPCKHNNENTSWEVKELQDISLEKEKTLSGGVVNESKLAEKSLSPDTHDDLGESNSMEKFENAAFFNDLEVNIDALETVQESLMERNEALSGDLILSITGEQSSIKDEKLNPCKHNSENTSWEVKELQDISLEKEKTLSGGLVNESKLAEKSLSPDTQDDLGESNSMEKFENAAFFNDLKVNIDALETVQESLMERNEASSGDLILSITGEQSSIKDEKLNPCKHNNENTSWEVKELQDISLEKEKTLSGGVVNESKLAEKSLSPDTHDDLGESNSMEKFENAAFFNDLEVNIDALETVQESLMERNEALSGDLILSITGEQSSIKDEKLNPCKHNSENTSWEVKELQDISLEKEKTLSGGLVNESKLAEKSLSPDTQDDLGESNSMEKFENAAFFNDLKVNIDALETVQESLMERNEASSGDLILSITGEQSSIKDEKLNPCKHNNENTSWEVKELQDISLEKEKTLSGGVVNESKLAEKSLSPDTHDDLGESNSMEKFENAAFFNDLEVNIDALETVQESLMERNEALSGDLILSITGEQSSIKDEKLNPCEHSNENTSWEVKELQDISLEKEKTLSGGLVNESRLAEKPLSPDTHDELGESNSMEKFENAAFFNDLEVKICALETIRESLMESNETSSGDQILSVMGEQSTIKSEKLNPWEQNNENTSWEVKGPQDISLLIDTTLKNRLVNKSKLAEKSLSPDTQDELRESSSVKKFENAAFFNNLEISIDALDTIQEPFMERNETSSKDQILSVMGEQSSIKSEKLNPCEQKNENTSWEVKELQNSSLEKEKTLNGGVANERKFAEKSLSPDTPDEELGESNSLEKLENAAFFSNFEMNIDALDQEPFMERNETSSGEFDLLEKFEKANFLNNLEGDIIELSGEKDQKRPQINEESKNTEDRTSDMDEENFPVLGIEISNQTDRSIQDISPFEDNLPRKEETVVKEDQIITISPVHIFSGKADCLDYIKTDDVCEESYDTDSTIVSEESYSTDESQSSASSSCADENLDYIDLNMQEASPSSQTGSQIDSVQNWKLNAFFETNQEQTGMQNSSEDGMFSSNLPMSSRTMSQESLFTQDSSYDWRGSMSELSDTSLCLGEGEVMPQWVWLNQDNMWEPYSRDMNTKLEKSFRRNPKSTTVVQIGIQLYRVIFSHMVQRNIETKEIFKIQRHEISS